MIKRLQKYIKKHKHVFARFSIVPLMSLIALLLSIPLIFIISYETTHPSASRLALASEEVNPPILPGEPVDEVAFSEFSIIESEVSFFQELPEGEWKVIADESSIGEIPQSYIRVESTKEANLNQFRGTLKPVRTIKNFTSSGKTGEVYKDSYGNEYVNIKGTNRWYKTKINTKPKIGNPNRNLEMNGEVYNKFIQSEREKLQEHNRKWKINPSDIADFYILESLIFRPKEHYPNDNENIQLQRGLSIINNIGDKVCIAILRTSLLENTSFGTQSDTKTAQKIRKQLDSKYVRRVVIRYLKATITELEKSKKNPHSLEIYKKTLIHIDKNPNMKPLDYDLFLLTDSFTYQLLYFKKLFNEVDTSKIKREDILKDRQFSADAFTLLSYTQNYKEWVTVAQYASAYLDPISEKSSYIPDSLDKKQRNIFIIDRLFNSTHYTGQLAEYTTNNFPESSVVMTMHGISGNSFDALWSYTSNQIRSELSGRSKKLLGNKKLPSVKYELSKNEHESFIDKLFSSTESLQYGVLLNEKSSEFTSEILIKLHNNPVKIDYTKLIKAYNILNDIFSINDHAFKINDIIPIN